MEVIAHLDKELLNVAEVALYTGWSKGYVRKLAEQGMLPYYRPGGRMIFFEKVEVLNFLRRNRVESITNITDNENYR